MCDIIYRVEKALTGHKLSQSLLPLLMVLQIMLTTPLSAQVVSFSSPVPIDVTDLRNPRSIETADFDGDGDLDLLATSWEQGITGWFEHIDGAGSFNRFRIITADHNRSNQSVSADFDGDGDQDIAVTADYSPRIAWYENLDGEGNFGTGVLIEESYLYRSRCIFPADLDGDGDQDLLAGRYYNLDVITWYENLDGTGNFAEREVITTNVDFPIDVYASDLDNDGDLDVLSASLYDDKIAWYENQDGQGNFSAQHIITATADAARSVFTSDLDGDGDQDVLAAAAGEMGGIFWYENIDDSYQFGEEQLITDSISQVLVVRADDLDGDGDQDVLSASNGDGTIAWYENLGNGESFGEIQIISDAAAGACDLLSADLDGDNDPDIISASTLDNKVAWYDNLTGQGTFGEQILISSVAIGSSTVISIDLDGDGDKDALVLGLEGRLIAWFENLDGCGIFGEQMELIVSSSSFSEIYTADLDGDDDPDLISISSTLDEIVWYQNLGGAVFSSGTVVTTLVDDIRDIFCSDLDNDLDLDIISASWNDNKLAWYENLDGAGSFGIQQVINETISGALSVWAEDLNGDGEVDLLVAGCDGNESNEVLWCENLGAASEFAVPEIVAANLRPNLTMVKAADLDDDGDNDVIFCDQTWHIGGGTAWCENLDGAGLFAARENISGGNHVLFRDLNLDSCLDLVLLASSYAGEGSYASSIWWLESLDCAGSFDSGNAIHHTSGTSGLRSYATADLDDDGDLDLLSALRGDLVWQRCETLWSPEIDIMVLPDCQIMLSWDPVPSTAYYNIYSSSTPYGVFEQIATTTVSCWNTTTGSEPVFFRVTAVWE